MPGIDRIVVDASVVTKAAITDGFDLLMRHRLCAPSLIWSEVVAAVGQLAWRGDIAASDADAALARVYAAAIDITDSRELMEPALGLARQLGWAKTYDAEYIVLAERLSAPFLTLDARLQVTAGRLIDVQKPSDL